MADIFCGSACGRGWQAAAFSPPRNARQITARAAMNRARMVMLLPWLSNSVCMALLLRVVRIFQRHRLRSARSVVDGNTRGILEGLGAGDDDLVAVLETLEDF